MPAVDRSPCNRRCLFVAALAILLFCGQFPEAHAVIFGGVGNDPIRDPGWPAGAAAVFNTKARIAYWEGPPFGGGQWHAECRGDTQAFQKVLDDFAKIEGPKKRLVVHDGVGRSFWLNPNREPAKQEAARTDWTFVVWQPDSWERQRKLPASLRTGEFASGDAAVPRIDLYTGGNVRWADVKLPEDVELVDQRLEAHGFSLDDGVVIEGTVVDVATDKPLPATIRLESMEPQEAGGYRHQLVSTTQADAAGRWVLKSIPAGLYRIIAEADGYVSRIAGYQQTEEGQPGWTGYKVGLARPALVTGQVTDDDQPLPDVEVQFLDLVDERGLPYESAGDRTARTDAAGRFRADQLPKGKLSIRLSKPDYVRPGLDLEAEAPAKDLSLRMMKSATLIVTVNFVDANRPAEYLVTIAPEGGEVVGSWGGSAQVDATGKVKFENIPPGRYILTGRPNPGSDAQQTPPILLELRGGVTTGQTLNPK